MSIDDLTYEERFGKTEKPHCLHNNILQYRTKEDDKTYYCCAQATHCKYYRPVKGNDHCIARYLKIGD